jgi:hypothetical protein
VQGGLTTTTAISTVGNGLDDFREGCCLVHPPILHRIHFLVKLNWLVRRRLLTMSSHRLRTIRWCHGDPGSSGGLKLRTVTVSGGIDNRLTVGVVGAMENQPHPSAQLIKYLFVSGPGLADELQKLCNEQIAFERSLTYLHRLESGATIAVFTPW